jgi:hypothetical protein
MSRRVLSKEQRQLIDIVRDEGGTILGMRNGGSHVKLDYTFDGVTTHVQHLPFGSSPGNRTLLNFRAAVKRAKNTPTKKD